MSNTTATPETDATNGVTVEIKAETTDRKVEGAAKAEDVKPEAPKGESSKDKPKVKTGAFDNFESRQDSIVERLQKLDNPSDAELDALLSDIVKVEAYAPELAGLLKAGMTSQTSYQLLRATDRLVTKSDLSDKEKTIAKCIRVHVAEIVCQQLDAEYNVMRADLCPDDGFGVYVEHGPLGYRGLGAGVVTKETKNGVTTAKRTGAGVYLRADHLLDSPRPVNKSIF